MGIYIQDHLNDKNGTRTIFRCRECHSHLFLSSAVVADSFHGKHGPGLLVNSVVNTRKGIKETREMMTGNYTVCDIHCLQCDCYLGWKYLAAECDDEKYKEQQYVVELADIWAPEKVKKRRSTMLNVWY